MCAHVPVHTLCLYVCVYQCSGCLYVFLGVCLFIGVMMSIGREEWGQGGGRGKMSKKRMGLEEG